MAAAAAQPTPAELQELQHFMEHSVVNIKSKRWGHAGREPFCCTCGQPASAEHKNEKHHRSRRENWWVESSGRSLKEKVAWCIIDKQGPGQKEPKIKPQLIKLAGYDNTGALSRAIRLAEQPSGSTDDGWEISGGEIAGTTMRQQFLDELRLCRENTEAVFAEVMHLQTRIEHLETGKGWDNGWGKGKMEQGEKGKKGNGKGKMKGEEGKMDKGNGQVFHTV